MQTPDTQEMLLKIYAKLAVIDTKLDWVLDQLPGIVDPIAFKESLNSHCQRAAAAAMAACGQPLLPPDFDSFQSGS